MLMVWCGGFLLGCAFMAIIDAYITHKRTIKYADQVEQYRWEKIRSQEETRRFENENDALKKKVNNVHKALCNGE